MANIHGKTKTAVSASKKRKGPGVTSSSSASAEACHPYLQFTAAVSIELRWSKSASLMTFAPLSPQPRGIDYSPSSSLLTWS
ncbi:hypothetical protein GOBAR_AA13118 [Gossypium barbadense]|uniref:Uncharacterized protein n=1 Tax=Gossypium barbadense TaxID=3634 RepID=A0A2P5XW22_GOSBA|nr:hypothetical protein GOBAR_AA13118 [Gossypium barbadense]